MATQQVPRLPSKNPLDDTMTRAQVAKRRFKSALPRKPCNVELSGMLALARTAEMYDQLRNEMRAVGLNPEHAQAALVYFQPHVKDVLANVVPLPAPEAVAKFCEQIMSLDKPVFLGVLFLQHDVEAKKAGDTKQADVIFGTAFTTSHDAEARMLAARESQRARGELKRFVN